jgi:hypothetical protein
MRYAQRGGYTPAEQQRRERLRWKPPGAPPAATRSIRSRTISALRGAVGGRVGIAGVAGCRARRPAAPVLPVARLPAAAGGEAKGFTWQDYRNLIIATITTCQPRSLVL